jgi:uncharacterized repeat protein (TIGR01451 family)
MNSKRVFIFVLLIICIDLFSQTGPGGVGNSGINVLWLDSNKLSGLNDNDDVLTWNDVSGNLNNLTAPSIALSPIYIANGTNGYPVVRFNKNNGRIRKTNFTNFPTNNITAIFVNKNNGESSDGVLSYASSGHNNDFLLFNSSNLRVYRRNPRTSNVSFNNNQWHIGNATWQSSGGVVTVWKDGSLDYSRTAFTAGSSITPNGSLALAAEQDSVDDRYDASQAHFGDFPEVIIYNIVLNNAQHIIVSNYLSAKYNTILASNNFYDEDTNSDFDHNVAGIGQHTDGTNHTDSQGTGIIKINNPSNLEDNEYLFWGENVKNSTYNFSEIATGYIKYRLNTTWRVSETGDVGTVNLSINSSDLNLTGIPTETLKLVRSTTSDFNSIVETYNLSLSGGVYSTNVLFDNDDYFTLEIVPLADLSIKSSVNKSIPNKGDQIIYTITLTNSGPQEATGVQVKSLLPMGLQYDVSNSVIPTGTIYNSTTGIWDFGNETILNGTTITLTLAAIAQVENIVLKNISEITAVDQEDVDSIPNNRN